MRILFIDTAIDGHHITYLHHLVQNVNGESFAILPERIAELECEQFVYGEIDMNKKSVIIILLSRDNVTI